MFQSICIVASTLPASFIAQNLQTLSVTKVVAMSPELMRSYGYLKKITPNLNVVTAPAGLLFQALYFFGLLLFIKVTKKKLLIFHECCMPILDLLIHWIKPLGSYYPQVSMLGSVPVSFESLPKSKSFALLKLLNLHHLFSCYYSPPVGENPAEYSLAFSQYPDSIDCYDVSHSRKFVDEGGETSSSSEDSLLLLLGKSMVSDAEQIKIFTDIVEFATAHSLTCYIKDHPNPYFRLGFSHHQAVTIDPEMPSELLSNNFSWVVGSSSTSLLNYGDRAISVIEMFEGASEEDLALLKKHFDMASPANKIRYTTSRDMLFKLLIDIKNT